MFRPIKKNLKPTSTSSHHGVSIRFFNPEALRQLPYLGWLLDSEKPRRFTVGMSFPSRMVEGSQNEWKVVQVSSPQQFFLEVKKSDEVVTMGNYGDGRQA